MKALWGWLLLEPNEYTLQHTSEDLNMGKPESQPLELRTIGYTSIDFSIQIASEIWVPCTTNKGLMDQFGHATIKGLSCTNLMVPQLKDSHVPIYSYY